MTNKIFRNILLVSIVSVLLASIFIIASLYGVFSSSLNEQLKTETLYISKALDAAQENRSYLESISIGSNRITWVASDGAVIFDSHTDPASMDNHLSRPEIQEALTSSAGSSSRYSSTLSEQTFYYATRLADGSVLRLSNTRSSIFGTLYSMITIFLYILLGVVIFSAVLARLLAKQIVKPINELDLESPVNNDTYAEISPLLHRIGKQNVRIEQQIEEITKQQSEFSMVIDNMTEGLIILDANTNILSINNAARHIFGCEGDNAVGANALALDRSLAFQRIIKALPSAHPFEEPLYINNRHYAVYVNSTSGAVQAGTVLFIVNIEDKYAAEQQRKEFSANVSHELKTPLTSISGYAEIMRNGLADPDDTADFSNRIFEEATRLISLIDDIMKLSRLDENKINIEKEHVDLLALAQDVGKRLMPAAENMSVSIEILGEPFSVMGMRQVLDEMLYNLMDNAIKYNRLGGCIKVEVYKKEDKTILSVSDTGIGIPQAYQQKVFERFYRVDKSHSKDTGGTGLGLAIVKHGAELHNADVELNSQEDGGTQIKIIF